ncbi:PREDICTED: putative F-box protein At1g50870 [Camelina sativa]|uniref:F-box protein At1g50870 n=1 Tax=Camelina sativa TaxID=90675 RepID=A0ABM0Y4D1_CAMSA|nr:PREDICTED: putative F-box protein At1g50870 [Camelina sativa]
MERATHDEEEEEEEYRSQPDPIPLDLILEILSRLPAKSIVRFLCVSKLLSSFTTLPSFISSFASRPRRLLLTFFKKKRRFVFSLPHHENTDGSYSPVYSYEIQNANTWRRKNCYKSSASIQGFILFKRNEIWNPTTGQVLHFPCATRTLNIRGQFFLGYDPLEGKYKVLLVSSQQQHGILTLGAQESWRFIPKGSPIHFCTGYYGCIDGVIYYRAFLGIGGECCIMSFHVGSEKFNPINYPEGYSPSSSSMIIPYEEGRLALVDTGYSPNISVKLWVLEDADGHEWTCKSFTLPPRRGWRSSCSLNLKGVSDAGELVFTPMELTDSFNVLYFEPRRNTIREALFEGIFGNKFGCRYGLGDYNSKYSSTFDFDVFPNHMENFVSLL